METERRGSERAVEEEEPSEVEGGNKTGKERKTESGEGTIVSGGGGRGGEVEGTGIENSGRGRRVMKGERSS